MGFFSRIKDAMTNRKVAGVELVTTVGNNYISWSGAIYNADIVRACIRPKVKAVGKLVGKHLREIMDEEGHTELRVNPSNAMKFLLEEPNPLMSGQQLQEKLATQLCLNSNAFALINRDEYGTPMELYPIVAQSVEAVYDATGRLNLRFTMMNSKVFEFSYEDIIHLRSDYNENDIFGTPIAPVLTPLLDVVTTTDQGVINAIKNSSVIRWLLKFSNSMRKEDLKSQAKDFADTFLATSEGMGVAAVDAKADAVQINTNDYVPNALQMDRTTKRIFDLFNTNDRIVSSAYDEELYNSYFDAEVEPVLIQLSQEYTRKLFSRRERVFGNRIVFEASSWDSASISTKLKLQAMVDRSALTPNEWRSTFNLAPVPGGDDPIRRLDTAAVDDKITTEGGNADES